MPYRVYRFSGADADTFLQGQLTQDIKTITQENCHYGAYCNHKGKMLANFLLSRDDSGALQVRIHQDQAEAVMKRLQMFILRSEVNITLLQLTCVAGNTAMATEICRYYDMILPKPFQCQRANGVTVYALPNDYYEVTLAADKVLPLSDDNKDSDAVEALRLQGGHFNIVPENNEMLLPQQTPLAEWGGISYTKGCYIGQEIIARNKYLGVVKKGLAVAIVEPAVEALPASPIKREEKSVGQIVELYRGKTYSVCLALLSFDSYGKTCHIDGVPAVFHSIVDNHQE